MIEAGLALVPVNPKLGRCELEHVLTDSAPDVILGAPTASCRRTPGARRSTAARGGELPGPRRRRRGRRAGRLHVGHHRPPEGRRAAAPRVASNLDALADAWEWTGEDVLTHGLPLFHVHGLVIGVLGPLRRGGELRHLGRFEPAAAAAALSDGATMLFGVPTMYHRIAPRGRGGPARSSRACSAARLLVSGRAPLPAPVFTRIEELTGQQVVERYGLTETLMNTAVRADSPRRPGYVGVPVPGVEVRLVADDGSDVEDSDDETIGEVAVRGPNLFSGYLNRPDATAEAIRDGWFFTGDIGTRAPDGYWRIVGRRSTDLIKTGGYKVGAGEIEVALLEHPGVREAAVTAAPDEDLGERIVAWVVPEDDAPAEHDLIDHVASELAPHKRPREVRFLDELPRNAMGKVVKAQLRRVLACLRATPGANDPRHRVDRGGGGRREARREPRPAGAS